MYDTKTQPLFSGWVFAFLACSKACNFGEQEAEESTKNQIL
jgi:hypothetical protein